MKQVLTASYRRTENERWEGVLKQDGKVIWACGHTHECRDNNNSPSYRHLGCAMKCARAELKLRQEKLYRHVEYVGGGQSVDHGLKTAAQFAADIK